MDVKKEAKELDYDKNIDKLYNCIIKTDLVLIAQSFFNQRYVTKSLDPAIFDLLLDVFKQSLSMAGNFSKILRKRKT
jgi:hypothetical protein